MYESIQQFPTAYYIITYFVLSKVKMSRVFVRVIEGKEIVEPNTPIAR